MPPVGLGLSIYASACRSWRPLVRGSMVSLGPTARFDFSQRKGDAGLHRRLVARADHSPRVPSAVWCCCFQLRVPGREVFRRVSVAASILLTALARAGSR
ncbi:hypothetical protein NDU88_003988 [Pleurodeles waltl]|uniref:Uncharacterized protein n=1 Tax=Pleurodeles waltl TaxID=8319 RepID=A0AAV7TR65_PLEWA|nr:hypothetical protein NDU88_003988 [Pleurodeles waltl]